MPRSNYQNFIEKGSRHEPFHCSLCRQVPQFAGLKLPRIEGPPNTLIVKHDIQKQQLQTKSMRVPAKYSKTTRKQYPLFQRQ